MREYVLFVVLAIGAQAAAAVRDKALTNAHATSTEGHGAVGWQQHHQHAVSGPSSSSEGSPLSWPGPSGGWPGPSGGDDWWPPGGDKKDKDELPLTTGMIVDFYSPLLDKFCNVGDADGLENAFRCSEKEGGTASTGMLVLGTDYSTNKIYDGDAISIKSQVAGKICGVGERDTGHAVVCNDYMTSDDKTFVIKRARHAGKDAYVIAPKSKPGHICHALPHKPHTVVCDRGHKATHQGTSDQLPAARASLTAGTLIGDAQSDDPEAFQTTGAGDVGAHYKASVFRITQASYYQAFGSASSSSSAAAST